MVSIAAASIALTEALASIALIVVASVAVALDTVATDLYTAVTLGQSTAVGSAAAMVEEAAAIKAMLNDSASLH